MNHHDRFWAKVDRNGPHATHSQTGEPIGRCWIWTASRKPRGYGQFGIGGLNLYAHRVAFEWTFGPIPEELQLDHVCRERACVNPAHLEAVTSAENTRRGGNQAAHRARYEAVTHCPRGHAYDEANTIRSEGNKRQCRECSRARVRARRARKR